MKLIKKYATLLIFVVAMSSINAQVEIKEVVVSKSQKIQINKMFENYLIEVQSKPVNWEKIVDYTYPVFFEFMERNSIVEQLKTAFNNPIYYINFDKMKLIEVQYGFEYLNISYCKVAYESNMSFHFTKQEQQDEKEFNEYVDFMLVAYKNQFKDAEVTKTDSVININGKKTIIAIYDKKYGESWKMLEFIKDNEIYYSMFLPEIVAKHISEKF